MQTRKFEPEKGKPTWGFEPQTCCLRTNQSPLKHEQAVSNNDTLTAIDLIYLPFLSSPLDVALTAWRVFWLYFRLYFRLYWRFHAPPQAFDYKAHWKRHLQADNRYYGGADQSCPLSSAVTSHGE